MQLVGFGYERHDDLADAFALLVLKICQESKKRNMIIWEMPRDGVEI